MERAGGIPGDLIGWGGSLAGRVVVVVGIAVVVTDRVAIGMEIGIDGSRGTSGLLVAGL